MAKQKKNVGKLDKLIRTILAIALGYISYTYLEGVWMWLLYIVAIGLLVTAFRGKCLIYNWLEINTNK